MRCGVGTNSGPPSFVTRATKSTIAFLAGPSFQEGISSWALARGDAQASARRSGSSGRSLEIVLTRALTRRSVSQAGLQLLHRLVDGERGRPLAGRELLEGLEERADQRGGRERDPRFRHDPVPVGV